MNTILDFITLHWGSITLVVAAVIYGYTHQALAIEYAKKKAAFIMLSIEANGEQYLLTTGLEKLEFATLQGYSLLPYLVKRFVTEDSFKVIVQDVFDKARTYAEAHKQV